MYRCWIYVETVEWNLHNSKVFRFVLYVVHKHLVNVHDDNQYIIEGVYFGENQMPWMIADIVHMKKGFIAELQHHMSSKASVCVRVSLVTTDIFF